jgi:transcriptional regulator with XRE-family HTH domain
MTELQAMQKKLEGRTLRQVARVSGVHNASLSRMARGTMKSIKPEQIEWIDEALSRLDANPSLKAGKRPGRRRSPNKVRRGPPAVTPHEKLAASVRRMLYRYQRYGDKGGAKKWSGLEKLIANIDADEKELA